MALFDLPEELTTPKKPTANTHIKLKKGQTVNDLIAQARQLVEEKLGKYKETSKCVTNIEDIRRFFTETQDLVALDTETTGLNVFTDELVGVCLCNGKESLYVPVNHKNAIYNLRVENQVSEQDLRQLFLDVIHNKSFRWIYHNAKFDLGVMRTFLKEPMPDPYWDTMLASYLFNQDEEHSLKYQYNKYIAVEDEGVNRFDTLFKGVTFDYVPIDVAAIYGGKDAFMTWELYQYQYKKMNEPEFSKMYEVFKTIEMPLLPILEDMYRDGININQKMLKELYEKYSAQLQVAEAKVHKEIEPYKDKIQEYRIQHLNNKLEDPINLGSPVQLSILFYDILGYKTKSGKGTGVHELEEINTPLTQALLELRKAQKLIDAFLVSLPKRIEPSDGKIHTHLNQYGAATGRFSSSDPNLQQIPSRGEAKELRRLFGASKGNVLLSSDFSQQEPRCLASLANELNMQETYRQGRDLYATMAAQAFHKEYWECMEEYLDENGKKNGIPFPEGKKRRSAIKGVLLGGQLSYAQLYSNI